jgi:hypothetical protein
MKEFAKLKNNIVINTVVCNDDWDSTLFDDSNEYDYIEYSKENPASIGGEYVDNFFYQVRPFDSWIKDGKGNWVAPTPKPTDVNLKYEWNEKTLNWDVLL